MFLKPNDPQLKKVSVEINPDDAKQIIKTMLRVAYGEQKHQNKPIMVGLAAPQIGIPKRIILVDVTADGKGLPATPRKLGLRGGRGDLRVYINPEIVWKSKRKGEWYEGCYSINKICGIVSRPILIKIKAFAMTPQGWKAKIEKYTGYVARIFQHEIDHLNGKLFADHITNPDHLHLVEEKEFSLYRDKQAWKNWPKKASLLLANQP